MDSPEISGVWILRSFYTEDVETGERFEPFGAKTNGVLILHPGGRMVGLVTPADQPAPTTDAERADAFRKLIAYSGLYRLEPPDRFVTSVDIAWSQPWIGTDQARTYTCSDTTLNIITAPARLPRSGDRLMVGVLSWEREGSARYP